MLLTLHEAFGQSFSADKITLAGFLGVARQCARNLGRQLSFLRFFIKSIPEGGSVA
jgi:hypothetical protein